MSLLLHRGGVDIRLLHISLNPPICLHMIVRPVLPTSTYDAYNRRLHAHQELFFILREIDNKVLRGSTFQSKNEASLRTTINSVVQQHSWASSVELLALKELGSVSTRTPKASLVNVRTVCRLLYQFNNDINALVVLLVILSLAAEQQLLSDFILNLKAAVHTANIKYNLPHDHQTTFKLLQKAMNNGSEEGRYYPPQWSNLFPPKSPILDMRSALLQMYLLHKPKPSSLTSIVDAGSSQLFKYSPSDSNGDNGNSTTSNNNTHTNDDAKNPNTSTTATTSDNKNPNNTNNSNTSTNHNTTYAMAGNGGGGAVGGVGTSTILSNTLSSITTTSSSAITAASGDATSQESPTKSQKSQQQHNNNKQQNPKTIEDDDDVYYFDLNTLVNRKRQTSCAASLQRQSSTDTTTTTSNAGISSYNGNNNYNIQNAEQQQQQQRDAAIQRCSSGHDRLQSTPTSSTSASQFGGGFHHNTMNDGEEDENGEIGQQQQQQQQRQNDQLDATPNDDAFSVNVLGQKQEHQQQQQQHELQGTNNESKNPHNNTNNTNNNNIIPNAALNDNINIDDLCEDMENLSIRSAIFHSQTEVHRTDLFLSYKTGDIAYTFDLPSINNNNNNNANKEGIGMTQEERVEQIKKQHEQAEEEQRPKLMSLENTDLSRALTHIVLKLDRRGVMNDDKYNKLNRDSLLSLLDSSLDNNTIKTLYHHSHPIHGIDSNSTMHQLYFGNQNNNNNNNNNQNEDNKTNGNNDNNNNIVSGLKNNDDLQQDENNTMDNDEKNNNNNMDNNTIHLDNINSFCLLIPPTQKTTNNFWNNNFFLKFKHRPSLATLPLLFLPRIQMAMRPFFCFNSYPSQMLVPLENEIFYPPLPPELLRLKQQQQQQHNNNNNNESSPSTEHLLSSSILQQIQDEQQQQYQNPPQPQVFPEPVQHAIALKTVQSRKVVNKKKTSVPPKFLKPQHLSYTISDRLHRYIFSLRLLPPVFLPSFNVLLNMKQRFEKLLIPDDDLCQLCIYHGFNYFNPKIFKIPNDVNITSLQHNPRGCVISRLGLASMLDNKNDQHILQQQYRYHFCSIHGTCSFPFLFALTVFNEFSRNPYRPSASLLNSPSSSSTTNDINRDRKGTRKETSNTNTTDTTTTATQEEEEEEDQKQQHQQHRPQTQQVINNEDYQQYFANVLLKSMNWLVRQLKSPVVYLLTLVEFSDDQLEEFYLLEKRKIVPNYTPAPGQSHRPHAIVIPDTLPLDVIEQRATTPHINENDKNENDNNNNNNNNNTNKHQSTTIQTMNDDEYIDVSNNTTTTTTKMNNDDQHDDDYYDDEKYYFSGVKNLNKNQDVDAKNNDDDNNNNNNNENNTDQNDEDDKRYISLTESIIEEVLEQERILQEKLYNDALLLAQQQKEQEEKDRQLQLQKEKDDVEKQQNPTTTTTTTAKPRGPKKKTAVNTTIPPLYVQSAQQLTSINPILMSSPVQLQTLTSTNTTSTTITTTTTTVGLLNQDNKKQEEQQTNNNINTMTDSTTAPTTTVLSSSNNTTMNNSTTTNTTTIDNTINKYSNNTTVILPEPYKRLRSNINSFPYEIDQENLPLFRQLLWLIENMNLQCKLRLFRHAGLLFHHSEPGQDDHYPGATMDRHSSYYNNLNAMIPVSMQQQQQHPGGILMSNGEQDNSGNGIMNPNVISSSGNMNYIQRDGLLSGSGSNNNTYTLTNANGNIDGINTQTLLSSINQSVTTIPTSKMGDDVIASSSDTLNMNLHTQQFLSVAQQHQQYVNNNYQPHLPPPIEEEQQLQLQQQQQSLNSRGFYIAEPAVLQRPKRTRHNTTLNQQLNQFVEIAHYNPHDNNNDIMTTSGITINGMVTPYAGGSSINSTNNDLQTNTNNLIKPTLRGRKSFQHHLLHNPDNLPPWVIEKLKKENIPVPPVNTPFCYLIKENNTTITLHIPAKKQKIVMADGQSSLTPNGNVANTGKKGNNNKAESSVDIDKTNNNNTTETSRNFNVLGNTPDTSYYFIIYTDDYQPPSPQQQQQLVQHNENVNVNTKPTTTSSSSSNKKNNTTNDNNNNNQAISSFSSPTSLIQSLATTTSTIINNNNNTNTNGNSHSTSVNSTGLVPLNMNIATASLITPLQIGATSDNGIITATNTNTTTTSSTTTGIGNNIIPLLPVTSGNHSSDSTTPATSTGKGKRGRKPNPTATATSTKTNTINVDAIASNAATVTTTTTTTKQRGTGTNTGGRGKKGKTATIVAADNNNDDQIDQVGTTTKGRGKGKKAATNTTATAKQQLATTPIINDPIYSTNNIINPTSQQQYQQQQQQHQEDQILAPPQHDQMHYYQQPQYTSYISDLATAPNNNNNTDKSSHPIIHHIDLGYYQPNHINSITNNHNTADNTHNTPIIAPSTGTTTTNTILPPSTPTQHSLTTNKINNSNNDSSTSSGRVNPILLQSPSRYLQQKQQYQQYQLEESIFYNNIHTNIHQISSSTMMASSQQQNDYNNQFSQDFQITSLQQPQQQPQQQHNSIYPQHYNQQDNIMRTSTGGSTSGRSTNTNIQPLIGATNTSNNLFQSSQTTTNNTNTTNQTSLSMLNDIINPRSSFFVDSFQEGCETTTGSTINQLNQNNTNMNITENNNNRNGIMFGYYNDLIDDLPTIASTLQLQPLIPSTNNNNIVNDNKNNQNTYNNTHNSFASSMLLGGDSPTLYPRDINSGNNNNNNGMSHFMNNNQQHQNNNNNNNYNTTTSSSTTNANMNAMMDDIDYYTLLSLPQGQHSGSSTVANTTTTIGTPLLNAQQHPNHTNNMLGTHSPITTPYQQQQQPLHPNQHNFFDFNCTDF